MNKPRSHFLLPGTLLVSTDPMEVTTLLGSCVSVCLWDSTKGIGGINHFMLAYWNGQGIASPKYGNIAMDTLLKRMYRFGSHKEHLVAKVFGGAQLLQTQQELLNIGQKNLQLAREFLSKEGIAIIASSEEGHRGRKIIFNTNNGLVKMKYLRASV